jgi:hypothetical protein
MPVADAATEQVGDALQRICTREMLHVGQTEPPLGIDVTAWVVNANNSLCASSLGSPLCCSLRWSVTDRDSSDLRMAVP